MYYQHTMRRDDTRDDIYSILAIIDGPAKYLRLLTAVRFAPELVSYKRTPQVYICRECAKCLRNRTVRLMRFLFVHAMWRAGCGALEKGVI